VLPCKELKLTNPHSIILVGDFNACVENNAMVWKGMIDEHNGANLHDYASIVL